MLLSGRVEKTLFKTSEHKLKAFREDSNQVSVRDRTMPESVTFTKSLPLPR